MSGIDDGIAQAFHVAAGELGMCTAAWLFVRETAREGDDRLRELRDYLGRAYPVLDAVAAAWLAGARAPKVDPARLLAACAGATRLLVIGLETAHLDALLPHLADQTAWLLKGNSFPTDWDRVLSNFEGRIQGIDLDTFQRLAGARSVLVVMTYGRRGEITYAPPEWLRVVGADVRMQFRSVIAWDVLAAPMEIYPIWLVETAVAEFSHVVEAA